MTNSHRGTADSKGFPLLSVAFSSSGQMLLMTLLFSYVGKTKVFISFLQLCQVDFPHSSVALPSFLLCWSLLRENSFLL